VRGSRKRSAPTQASKRLVVDDPTHQDAALEEASSALAREARPQRRGREGAAERRQARKKRGPRSAWLKAHGWKRMATIGQGKRGQRRGQGGAANNNRARQATPTQNSKSSVVQGVSDARCRPR
jgi:hypothetical protein